MVGNFIDSTLYDRVAALEEKVNRLLSENNNLREVNRVLLEDFERNVKLSPADFRPTLVHNIVETLLRVQSVAPTKNYVKKVKKTVQKRVDCSTRE